MVVGWVVSGSVSFAAIQMKRGDSRAVLGNVPAPAKCHLRTPSALAQPTHEPVLAWSPTCHQLSRRSFVEGNAPPAASKPASTAWVNCQSFSWFGDGSQLSTLAVAVAVAPPPAGRGMRYPPCALLGPISRPSPLWPAPHLLSAIQPGANG